MKPTAFGRYILVERIGSGGMGQVYLAVARGLWGFDKLFAVKKILPSLSQDPQFLTRFRDEARLVIPMNHPNVVQVYEVGRVGDEYFIAMELVEGVNLGKLLSKLWRHSYRQRLPIPAALFVIRELLAALAYCHQVTNLAGSRMRVVHRDVSPANVLLSFDGAVKLADFGLALSILKASQTEPNRVLGHLGYIAPEGLDGHRVDHRADIFCAGVLLFELLTCHRFAPGSDPIVVRRLIEARSRVLPSAIRGEVPHAVDALVARAVALDPQDRFPGAQEFHDAVQKVLVGMDALYGPRKLAASVLDPILLPDERRQRMRSLISGLDLEEIEAQTPAARTICIGEAIPLEPRRRPYGGEIPVLTIIEKQFEGDTEPMPLPPQPDDDQRHGCDHHQYDHDHDHDRAPSRRGLPRRRPLPSSRRAMRWRSPKPRGRPRRSQSDRPPWLESDTGSH